MHPAEVISKFRNSEAELRARGVRHAALFGSRARGDNRRDSDIDIMVEFAPDAHVTVFDDAGVKDYISWLFDGSVDVIDRDSFKPHPHAQTALDAIYAF